MAENDPPDRAGRRVRVLLVDDDELTHDVLLAHAAELGEGSLEIEWRSDSQAGLLALRDGSFDACLLDYRLGDRSGLDVLREAIASGIRTPIIMLTGQGGRELDVESTRAGAWDYLVKGEFGPVGLERSIRYAVERFRALEALRESEERYALALRGANDGLWDWKLPSGEIHFSPRWKEILGFADDEIANDVEEWYRRVHPSDLSRLLAEVDAHVRGESDRLECEYRIVHRDGSYRWVHSRALAVRDSTGKATRIAGSIRDVTQSRGFDPLTGLPNRVLFLDRLEGAMNRARGRSPHGFALLALDVDRFKVVNDSLGPAAGDLLLVEIARRIESSLRVTDTAARLGGDEFTILLDDLRDPNDAARAAAHIQAALSRGFQIRGRDLFASASIGIVLSSEGYEKPDDMLRDADIAMYRAKGGGRSRHEIFDRDMHVRALTRLQLESELRAGIEAGHLAVRYQPIVSLLGEDPGRLVGFEALVRWMHPERGLVPPDEFIPLAEETGLVVAIDRWVLREACRLLRRWRRRLGALPLTMSVNLSKKQLSDPNFVDAIAATLEETGTHPSSISFEITETAVMENAASALEPLRRLRSLGSLLVMDDFGTGYSSLAYLHRLPFSRVKIDQSFVARLPSEKDAAEIVRAILALSRALGAQVVAEGIETQEQFETLRSLGCDYGQGYYFSRPIGPDEAESLAARTSQLMVDSAGS